MVKIFITKHVLTKGIIEADADIITINDGKKRYAHVILPGDEYPVYITEKDFHYTRETAIQDANRRKEIKTVQLRKQIRKLENLSFF